MATDSSPSRFSLRTLFVTGLLTLLPLWLTWVVVKFVFGLLSDISRPLIEPLSERIAASFPHSLDWFHVLWVQNTIALLATVLVVLLFGLLTRYVVGRRLLRWFEALIERIPLANSIYGGARKLADILQPQTGGNQRVVLIEFPHPGIKAIGFVTRVIREEGTGRELAAVYVPTTPNPTGGYLEIVPVEQLIPTTWSVDQAMGIIISGGAMAPDSIPFSRR